MNRERALQVLEDIATFSKDSGSIAWSMEVNEAVEYIEKNLLPLPEQTKEFHDHRTAKEANRCSCPKCGHQHIIDRREVVLTRDMVKSLASIYKWCAEKGIHEFHRRDVNHLIVGLTAGARWGDWVYFGGLVYKPDGKGSWGLNLNRVREFLFEGHKIATKCWKDPLRKGEAVEPFAYKTAQEIPGVKEYLDENGMYQARYSGSETALFNASDTSES